MLDAVELQRCEVLVTNQVKIMEMIVHDLKEINKETGNGLDFTHLECGLVDIQKQLEVRDNDTDI